MNIHDATEQAYKNGYKQGTKDVLSCLVKCKECCNSDTLSCSKGMVWCGRMCRYMKENDFCSIGERKTHE